MLINSPGGSVVDGLSVIDTMKLIDAKVATTNIGMCASMGSLFLAAGEPGLRSTYESAKTMIHQASFGSRGHVNDNQITQIEGEKSKL